MEEKTHKSGFDAPEGYFESFEDRLMLRIMEEKLPKSTGFTMPDGYLDTIEDRVVGALEQDKQPKIISLFRSKTLLYAVSAAACLVLVFSVFNSVGDEISFDDISAAEVEHYLNESGIRINSSEVLALLNDEEITELTTSSQLISDENLEDYLIENLDETSLLIEQQ